MTTPTAAPRLAASYPAIPLRRRLYGFGSIYGKTIRDSRLAFLVMSGLIVGFMFAVGEAFGTAYGTAASRLEVVKLVESVPPIMAGMAGNTVAVDTMGGFLTYKYGPLFAFLASLWSILALSGTLAAEARRGSLDFIAVAPFGKRRIATEKVLAHVTMLGLSMALLALAAWVTGAAFGVPELGDQIAPLEAVGFALWVGLIALACGSIAFALSTLVGRGAAAGIAGIVLLGGFVVGNYAPYVPALDVVANLSWFHWTYDHVPLAGQFDWLSLAAVGAIAITLLVVGVELFRRRDLGVTTSLPIPGLPSVTLGTHGPVGRAAGDQLPLALGWGLGIGVFGFVIAAASQSFTDELLQNSPSIAELLRTVFPNVDFLSAGGFLQLVFVEIGLIVVGLSAATYVSRWASDEGSGRLELLLTTPLERARWALAGGVGALVAVVVSMAIYAPGHRARRGLRRQRRAHAHGRGAGDVPVRGGHGRRRRGHRRALAHIAGGGAGGRGRDRHLPGQPAGAGPRAARLVPSAGADGPPGPAHGRDLGRAGDRRLRRARGRRHRPRCLGHAPARRGLMRPGPTHRARPTAAAGPTRYLTLPAVMPSTMCRLKTM